MQAVRGRVAQFDEAVGIGEVEAEDGTRYFFHCTQIADGSRTIEVDVSVTFEIRPGHLGKWEATAVTPASPGR